MTLDSRVQPVTQQTKTSSLYGFDLSNFVREHTAHAGSAYELAAYVLTHGGNYPIELGHDALGLFDQAALAVLDAHRALPVTAQPHGDGQQLAMWVNTLGRLHIRPAHARIPQYDENDHWTELGYVAIDAVLAGEIEDRLTGLRRREAEAFGPIKQALDEVERNGQLGEVLGEVIDHVEHVESVCFYVHDRFFALIDRYVNLIDDKRNRGFLSQLRDKPYADWNQDEVLVVAALHALFLSGRAVRFEEFNGAMLTAHRLTERLAELAHGYSTAGCEVEVDGALDIFERARQIRKQTLCAQGKPWVRYRWVYGLTFQKIERIIPAATQSGESATACQAEFADLYRQLVSDRADLQMPETVFMAQLANACLARDLAGIPCEQGSAAAAGWVEYLMERIVASAVVATGADYGMSSSVRDMGQLVHYDEASVDAVIHSMTPAHFFTCFVGDRLVPRLGAEEANVIATSVQKRMMFNRWHFIPGNLERERISASRHWYYPPLVPDIGVHADMHRAAHNRARVKFSIRSPGPDASRPPLHIGGQRYRGIYDVRVVRMDGAEFKVEDILKVRRRTLWLEAVYAAVTAYLMSAGAGQFEIRGFQPGAYLDLPAAGKQGG